MATLSDAFNMPLEKKEEKTILEDDRSPFAGSYVRDNEANTYLRDNDPKLKSSTLSGYGKWNMST